MLAQTKTTQFIHKYKSWNKKNWRRRPFIYWILTVVTQGYIKDSATVRSAQDLFMNGVANAGYWNDSKLHVHIMKFLGTHTHSNDRVTLDWQFQIGKCAQIREKLRKIRLLIRYTGAVLSVICYSCREESVTRLVRNHKARYQVP